MHINYSRSELHLLSEYSRGTDGIKDLSVKLKISITQTYRVIESLRKKNVVVLKNGKIVNENRTHIILLLNILRNSEDAYIPLSDRGMEIMMMMKEPVTMREIACGTGLNVSTVSRKIRQMSGLSMIVRDGMKYSLNYKVWNELSDLFSETEKYERNVDPRVPNGCEIYHSDERLAMFSSVSDVPFTKTAFSVFDKFGIKMYLAINYYTTENTDITVDKAFLHSLWVISKYNDWKLKTMSLIFYVKNKKRLQNIRHPIKDEMDAIISGKEVKGWVPVKEMQERADMYGVKIIDNGC